MMTLALNCIEAATAAKVAAANPAPLLMIVTFPNCFDGRHQVLLSMTERKSGRDL